MYIENFVRVDLYPVAILQGRREPNIIIKALFFTILVSIQANSVYKFAVMLALNVVEHPIYSSMCKHSTGITIIRYVEKGKSFLCVFILPK